MDLNAAVWAALVERCASHPPHEHHLVKRLVMVSRDDVTAAVDAALTARARRPAMAGEGGE